MKSSHIKDQGEGFQMNSKKKTPRLLGVRAIGDRN